MNVEQVKSDLRTLIATFGGLLAGWLVAHHWASDSASVIALMLAMTPLLANLIVGISGHFTHSESNAVLVVDTIAKEPGSPVRGVITEPNVAGRALASNTPGSTTVVAGTAAAEKLASS